VLDLNMSLSSCREVGLQNSALDVPCERAIKKTNTTAHQNLKDGSPLTSEMLSQVADLLSGALSIHHAVKNVILCTREGVVVAAVSREEQIDPRLLATVSAALTWVGGTTLRKVSKSSPSSIYLVTAHERVITLIQPNYCMILVVSLDEGPYFDLRAHLANLQSISTRIEILMTTSPQFGSTTVLSNVVRGIPEINRAMLLTIDGLPLGSVGFTNEIEVAGLVGSMFANGLTFSEETDHIVLESDEASLLVVRVDESRLLAVVCGKGRAHDLCERVVDVVRQSV